MRRSWKEAFRGKLPLFLLLGGLLAVTAVAGVLVAGRQEEKKDPGQQLADLNEPASQSYHMEPTEEVKADVPPETEALEKPAQAEPETERETQGGPAQAAEAKPQTRTLSFSVDKGLEWPVRGNVVLDYSMDSTIYFPTLDQYKCNPAVVIQAEPGIQVKSPAEARVVSVSSNEEIGNYVVLDLGSDYRATVGQLGNVQVKKGQYVEPGTVIGFAAEPTKYYVVEGCNIYFSLQKADTYLDPMDYMD